ncbi:MAG: ATP-grasp domain-containing protein [Parasphingopyxis sp.]|uniref:ATP-grasp domain-containing protein n=1 Tax=Parasphingopyxis sp. TaxID=1920299 RepID=UPI003F9F9219
MRIAYLACRLTLPDSPERRPDAFEHDQMMECLSAAFAAHYATVEAIAWDDEDADWRRFDAVLIGSTWDYQDHLQRFLDRLAKIESQTMLFNDSATVRWNCRKTYLKDLSERGARTVPTVWLDRPAGANVEQAFDALGSDDLVFKRQVGANAEGQFRLKRGDPVPPMPEPMMAQPFLPAIQSEGEMSLVFIDGAFSHGLVKSAADGDYRIQSSYGGREKPCTPDAADIAAATSILETLAETPLYARIDMVRGTDGDMLLMELELVEPFLYPLQADGLGERIYDAAARRLSTI